MKIFTALFLALTIMPAMAMYRSDCEAIVRNCLTVRSSSPHNDCRESDEKLPGIDSDPMIQEYVAKYRAIVDSDKPDEQRRSEKDALTNKYKATLIEKYCKDYTYYAPGSNQDKDNARQAAIAKCRSFIKDSIDNGVKNGDTINIEKINGERCSYNELLPDLQKWDKACRSATAPAEAKMVAKEDGINAKFIHKCTFECNKGYDKQDGKCVKKANTSSQEKTDENSENQNNKQLKINKAIQNFKNSINEGNWPNKHSPKASDRDEQNIFLEPEVKKYCKKWADACNAAKVPGYKLKAKNDFVGSEATTPCNKICSVTGCDTGYEEKTDGTKKQCVKKDTEKEKAACEAKKTNGAKWSVNKCTCTDKNKEWKDSDCVEKTISENETKCSEKNGTWNKTLKKCYCGAKEQSLTDDAQKCPTKEDKAQAKQETKAADEAYSKEIDEIIAAYKQVVAKLKSECEGQGGTLTDTECKKN